MPKEEYISKNYTLYLVNYFGNMQTWSKEDIISEIKRKITEDTAANVEEIVRCKDCIFRGREDCAMFYRCDCGEQHTWETDNDFCSYGERRK